VEVLRVLGELGADLDATTSDGRCAIHIAAFTGRADVIRVLVEVGVDVNKKYNISAFAIAAYQGFVEVINVLFELGFKVSGPGVQGYYPVHAAAFEGHVEVIRILVKHGADINTSGPDGLTAVFIATHNGHVQTIKALFEQGADINSPNSDEVTPINLAARHGLVEVVKVLCELGADFNKRDKSGASPIANAAIGGYVDVIAVLANVKANINEQTLAGDTPLFLATQNGHVAAVRVLSQLGANVNTPTLHQGCTPVYVATQLGLLNVVELLSDLGADLNKANSDGFTPAHVAAMCGHVEIIKLLDRLGADIRRRAIETGFSPLIMAANFGQVEVIRALFELGVDLDDRACDGATTPLLLASRNGHAEVVRILLDLSSSHLQLLQKRNNSSVAYTAAYNGHIGVLKVLSERNVDLEGRVTDVEYLGNPVHVAALLDNVDEMNYLIQCGVDVSLDHVSIYSEESYIIEEMVSKFRRRILLSDEEVHDCRFTDSVIYCLFSLTKLMGYIFFDYDKIVMVDADLRYSLERTMGATMIRTVSCSAIKRMQSTPYVLRRKIVGIAYRVYQASLLPLGAAYLTDAIKTNRYTCLVCFLLNSRMLGDVLALRLTCKSNLKQRRFPISGNRALEANVIEEWLVCGDDCSSRFVDTSTICNVLQMLRSVGTCL
jgi:ankyrin repeat protein